ncbi:unnamed protein product (macronuclear) [Paramecium tetraurelia]|uniref:HTH psq-type domain-containing protein n=1 Tax=Paramecium tetraurelia TaxID=5888 RepID=A0DSB1_PARTE|nr:uncharacterized protein GSPATT00019632001 [Paramecium tetraurelia]CAK85928.1 unnamed protein product [Paramecium tetraurelia]|eukprot:XP_001453325.1 hypothetical protein (macronuclear) [Paramecium tetraurelia strain d4-2]
MAKMSASKRQYVKISKIQKQSLLQLVFDYGMKIREASQKLNLKYAAAKTFVLQFRKKLLRKEFNYASDKPCQTCPKRDVYTPFKIVSQIGGKEISSKTYIYN